MNTAKYEKAIEKIFNLTESGNLTWKRELSMPTLMLPRSKRFTTEYKGETLRISELDPVTAATMDTQTGMAFAYRNVRSILESIDANGKVQYAFPPMPVTDKLLKLVDEKGTAIDQFVERVLGDD